MFPFKVKLHILNIQQGNSIITMQVIHSQKVHPKVASKIADAVRSGISETAEVNRSLKCYADTILFEELGHKPHP